MSPRSPERNCNVQCHQGVEIQSDSGTASRGLTRIRIHGRVPPGYFCLVLLAISHHGRKSQLNLFHAVSPRAHLVRARQVSERCFRNLLSYRLRVISLASILSSKQNLKI